MAEFLEALPPKKFNLKIFIEAQNKITPDKGLKEPTCGTTACMLGYIPCVFPRNFVYNKDTVFGEYIEVDPREPGGEHIDDFLGFDQDNYFLLNYVTMHDYYPKTKRGPKSVAKRIRDMVEGKPFAITRYDN